MTSFLSATLLSFVLSALFLVLLLGAKKQQWSFANASAVWLVCMLASLTPFLLMFHWFADYSSSISQFVWQGGQHSTLAEYYTHTQTLLNSSGELWTYWNELCATIAISLVGISLFGVWRFARSLRKINVFVQRLPSLSYDALLLCKHQKQLVKYNVITKTTTENIAPFAFGFWRPTLVIPSFILSMPALKQQALIEHELMHIKRNDHRTLWWVKCLSAIFCFNPLMKSFAKHFVVAMEFNCDADVLEQTKINKRDYADSFLHCLKRASTPAYASILAGFGTYNNQASQQKGNYMSINQARLLHMLADSHKIAKGTQRLFMVGVLSTTLMTNIAIAALQPAQSNLSQWALPIDDFRLTSQYGKSHPIVKNTHHKGIDLTAARGTKVNSVNAGIVVIADNKTLNKNYGNVVVIDHGNGYKSLYAHLDNIQVASGDKVSTGAVVGALGSTGKTSGPHLHFELHKDEAPVNPAHYLSLIE